MLKIALHMLVIVLVAGIVAGGLYLAVENGGLIFIGGVNLLEGRPAGSEGGTYFPGGQMRARPERQGFSEGEIPARGDFLSGEHGTEDEMGFSLAGLSGVIVQAGKIAVITVVIVAVQAVVQFFKRRISINRAAA